MQPTRSIVRESLILVTAAAVVMATLAQGLPTWVAVGMVTGPTTGILLLRRCWRCSFMATTLGAMLGMAVPLALIGFVTGLLQPPAGLRSRFGPGLESGVIAGGLGFVLGILFGMLYGLVTGLALELWSGRSEPRGDSS